MNTASVPTLRELDAADLPETEGLLDAALGGRMQARLGDLVDVLTLPGMFACSHGGPVWIRGCQSGSGSTRRRRASTVARP